MGLFKKMEVPGDIDRVPELRDRVIILAYLEELQTLGTHAYLQPPGELALPLQVRVDSVSEERKEFELALSRALPGTLKAKDMLKLFFGIDGQRFVCEVPFRNRSGFLHAQFALPTSVRHDERRSQARVRFSPREKASITILEGLAHGHGVYGRLVNLSLTGACVRIDRAIAVNGQRRVNVAADLYHSGGRLDFIRIQDLPHIPMIECAGRAAWMERTPMGVLMGLSFEDMDSLETQMLAQFVGKRLPGGLGGFPLRHPKSRRQANETPEPPPTEESWEDLPETSDAQDQVSQVLERPDTHARLLLLKKRGKRILVLMQDDLDRAILAGTLQVDGFTRTAEARNFVMAFAWLKQHPADLLIVDHHLGMHTAQQVVDRLRQAGFLEDTPILLVSEKGDVRANLMARVAQFQAVLHNPIDYDGEMRDLVYRILKIE